MTITTVQDLIAGALSVSFGLVPFYLLVLITWQRKYKS